MRRRATVAVLAPEPIRPRMAGMGIRALELARAIGREFDVRLLVPNDPAEAEEVAAGVPVVSTSPDLARAAAGARAVVVSGHAANSWFHQVPDVPVAADLYDPFPIENLHYARTLGEETARHDRETGEQLVLDSRQAVSRNVVADIEPIRYAGTGGLG